MVSCKTCGAVYDGETEVHFCQEAPTQMESTQEDTDE